jgi:hypothetical protein
MLNHPPLAIIPHSRPIQDLTDPGLIELYQCPVTHLRCRIPGTLKRDPRIQLSPVDSATFGRPSLNFQGVYVLCRMTFSCLSVLSVSRRQQKLQRASSRIFEERVSQATRLSNHPDTVRPESWPWGYVFESFCVVCVSTATRISSWV